MNGAHDLGGMQGLGPIDPEPEDSEPWFHAEWERRMFAVTLAVSAHGKWTLDASRHARERQHPIDYLKHSYYENWLVGTDTLLLEAGLVTEDELRGAAPSALAPDDQRATTLQADQVAPVLARGGPTLVDVDMPSRFAIGDRVRVVKTHTDGHTRAPRYARGCEGVIEAHHGVHVFADKNAHGVREGQPLYGVAFTARELWGADAPARDIVRIDLWEPHLEPA